MRPKVTSRYVGGSTTCTPQSGTCEGEMTSAGVWVAGFGTGGSLAIVAGAEDAGVRGVAALGAPADFDDWASHPRRLLEHSREVGLIRSKGFPV